MGTEASAVERRLVYFESSKTLRSGAATACRPFDGLALGRDLSQRHIELLNLGKAIEI